MSEHPKLPFENHGEGGEKVGEDDGDHVEEVHGVTEGWEREQPAMGEDRVDVASDARVTGVDEPTQCQWEDRSMGGAVEVVVDGPIPCLQGWIKSVQGPETRENRDGPADEDELSGALFLLCLSLESGKVVPKEQPHDIWANPILRLDVNEQVMFDVIGVKHFGLFP